MKKHISGLILSILLILVVAPVYSNIQLPGAVYQNDVIGLDLTVEGQMVNIEDETIKILTADGVKMYQEIVRSWWADTQELVIESAEVITSEGVHIKLKPEWIKEIHPEELKNGPYDNFRLTVLSYPELKPPCTIKYRITIKNKKPLPQKAFWSGSYTQDFSPIGRTEFTVKIPKDTRLNYLYVGDPKVMPEIEEVGEFKKYTWESTERPAIKHEPFMPPLVQIASKVMAGSFASWQDLAKWAHDIVEERISSDSALYSYARRIVWGKKDRIEKIKAIYRAIVAIPVVKDDAPGIRWDTTAKISEVINAKKLIPSDRALLLAGTLKAAGFHPRVVLASSKDVGKLNTAFPTPQFFDSMLVYLPRERLYLDPNDQYAGFGEISHSLLGCGALILAPDTTEPIKLPLFSAQDNREEMQAEIVVDDNGNVDEAIGLLETGINREIWAGILDKTKGEELDRLFQFLVKQVNSAAKLDDYNIVENTDKKVKINMKLKIDDYAMKSGKYLIVRQPTILTRQFNKLLYQKSPRLYPIVLGNPSMEEKRIHLVVPDKYRALSIPENRMIENDVGSIQVIGKSDNNSVRLVIRMILNMEEVPPDKFDMVKDLIKAINEAEKEVFLLEER
ncbi:MAG: DUF3857 domain-containing protein [Candidatus Eremiobacteraeota bacterium]|nr:DUF3857 domain-containing protein [Candidatus Eremiobacteraeota bacterium]